jgi:hypothetical protein
MTLDIYDIGNTSYSAYDIMRIQILERRARVINLFNNYNKYKFMGNYYPSHELRAEITGLFLELSAVIKRKIPKEYDKLKADLLNKDTKLNIIIEDWFILDEFLDKLNLTKIDNMFQSKLPAYDEVGRNVEKGY